MAHLIAAGGTGQEIALGLLRVNYITGRPMPNITVVDSDVSGNSGAAEGYMTRKQTLDALANRLLSLGIVGEQFIQTVNPTDLSASDVHGGRPVSVRTVRDVFRAPGQGAMESEDDLVLDLLLSTEQRNTTIDDGFHGEPALGALIVRAVIESGGWKPFLGRLAQEAGEAGGLRVLIAGSVLGGVGTAVLPSLVDQLEQVGGAGKGVSIHGLFLLPWFLLEQTAQDVTARPPDVNRAMMERNASGLMHGYLEHIVTRQLQSAALLGLPQPVPRTSQGGSLQRETLHYLNVIAALTAQRMLAGDQWRQQGVVGVAIGNDPSRHYEGRADGPSVGDFTLRRIANLSRALVAVTAALRFEVAQGDPAVTHHESIGRLLKRQTPAERERFITTIKGYHALHLDIWSWLARSLEAQVGTKRADTLNAFEPDEGWQRFRKAGVDRALQIAGVKSWWLPLGRRLLRRLGPFEVPVDSRGEAAAASVVRMARERLVQFTGSSKGNHT